VTRKITSWLADAFTTVEKHVFAFLEDRKTEQNFISVQNGFDLSLKNGVIKKLQLGNLLAKRDWQHCFDAAVGISKILEKDEFELYVLGTGETYSIEDFLRMAFEVVGVSNWRDFVEISEAYMRPSEVNLLLSDPSKARKELGWVSTYDIKRIVSEMVFTDIERNRNAVSVGSRPN
jgi:GDPmannose 4,6-dehydratase